MLSFLQLNRLKRIFVSEAKRYITPPLIMKVIAHKKCRAGIRDVPRIFELSNFFIQKLQYLLCDSVLVISVYLN